MRKVMTRTLGLVTDSVGCLLCLQGTVGCPVHWAQTALDIVNSCRHVHQYSSHTDIIQLQNALTAVHEKMETKWITRDFALPRIEHRPLHPTRRRNSRLTIHIQFHLVLAHTTPALSTYAVPSTARRPPHTAATHPRCPRAVGARPTRHAKLSRTCAALSVQLLRVHARPPRAALCGPFTLRLPSRSSTRTAPAGRRASHPAARSYKRARTLRCRTVRWRVLCTWGWRWVRMCTLLCVGRR